MKSEPQIVKNEIIIRTPLDELTKEVGNLETEIRIKQKQLIDKETKFAEEENVRKQEKLKAEIEQIQTIIREKNAAIEKLRVETEEIKKTHAKKREVMENIQKEGE